MKKFRSIKITIESEKEWKWKFFYFSVFMIGIVLTIFEIGIFRKTLINQ